jgi:hypothetical protein
MGNMLHSIVNPDRTSDSAAEPVRNAKNKLKKAKTAVTYLNVHAGLSVGVMAGLDVGAHDRFEVFVNFIEVLTSGVLVDGNALACKFCVFLAMYRSTYF